MHMRYCSSDLCYSDLGSAVVNVTGPVIWGGFGSSTQHSFFQSLHQGTDTVPADFIGVVRPAHTLAGHHHALLANLLAQTQALACGEENEDGHRRYPGDRPSTVLLLDELNTETSEDRSGRERVCR